MKDKAIGFAVRKPILFVAITGLIAMLATFLVGFFLAGFNLLSSETAAEWTFNYVTEIPKIILWLFIYRFLTTGQIRHVQAPSKV